MVLIFNLLFIHLFIYFNELKKDESLFNQDDFFLVPKDLPKNFPSMMVHALISNSKLRRQEDFCEFEGNPVYRMSSRTVWTAEKDPVSTPPPLKKRLFQLSSQYVRQLVLLKVYAGIRNGCLNAACCSLTEFSESSYTSPFGPCL